MFKYLIQILSNLLLYVLLFRYLFFYKLKYDIIFYVYVILVFFLIYIFFFATIIMKNFFLDVCPIIFFIYICYCVYKKSKYIFLIFMILIKINLFIFYVNSNFLKFNSLLNSSLKTLILDNLDMVSFCKNQNPGIVEISIGVGFIGLVGCVLVYKNYQDFVKESIFKINELQLSQDYLKRNTFRLKNELTSLNTDVVLYIRANSIVQKENILLKNNTYKNILDLNRIYKNNELGLVNGQFFLKGVGYIDRTRVGRTYAIERSSDKLVLLKEFLVRRDHKILYAYYKEYRIFFLNTCLDDLPKHLLNVTGFLTGFDEFESFKEFYRKFKTLVKK